MGYRFSVTILLILVIFPALAFADNHKWLISEIYSNSDGTIQFVELVDDGDDAGWILLDHGDGKGVAALDACDRARVRRLPAALRVEACAVEHHRPAAGFQRCHSEYSRLACEEVGVGLIEGLGGRKRWSRRGSWRRCGRRRLGSSILGLRSSRSLGCRDCRLGGCRCRLGRWRRRFGGWRSRWRRLGWWWNGA